MVVLFLPLSVLAFISLFYSLFLYLCCIPLIFLSIFIKLTVIVRYRTFVVCYIAIFASNTNIGNFFGGEHFVTRGSYTLGPDSNHPGLDGGRWRRRARSQTADPSSPVPPEPRLHSHQRRSSVAALVYNCSPRGRFMLIKL